MTEQDTIIYNKEQILQLEKTAGEHYDLPPEQLMQYAGQATFRVLQETWPDAKNILVVTGVGNNAGDGYVLAWLAKQADLNVSIAYLAEPTELKGIAWAAAETCKDAAIEIQQFHPSQLHDTDLIVDAIFGSGITRNVTGHWKDAINNINASDCPVLSIDVPSGVDADTGCAYDVAIDADVTITFIGLKQGLLTGHGPAYSGKVICDRLQIPDAAFSNQHKIGHCLTAENLKPLIKPRRRDVYKGMCGHVLIVGGDYGMAGAVRMAAQAAYRVGAGLVSVATRAEHVPIVTGAVPEVMCHAVESSVDLYSLLSNATFVVVGPGLGRTRWGRNLLNAVLQSKLPLLIDADGLSILGERQQQPRDNWILTPHPGEASRLLRYSAAKIQANRFQAVIDLQNRLGGVSVLKGTGTLIKNNEHTVELCQAGNPGMATGGMGDILSGVIAGLVAQKHTLYDAARLGVFVHSTAADLASKEGGERGMMATDLIPFLRSQLN